jgi:hypothetical protein
MLGLRELDLMPKWKKWKSLICGDSECKFFDNRNIIVRAIEITDLVGSVSDKPALKGGVDVSESLSLKMNLVPMIV